MSFAASVNGRFKVVKSDKANFSVLLQINTNTGNDDMGGATLVLSYDKNVIDFSSNPELNKDYTFHNFSGGNYNEATVTNPLSDKIWINIDLPKENSNKGKVVADTTGWTDVVTLNFNVKNPNDTARIKWMHKNIFWQVYDADNSSSWSVGKFTDLVSAPPKIELLSFTAKLLDESDIQLDWSTISYEESVGFEVYKITTPSVSPPSKGGDVGEKVGFVESKKILNTSVGYSFIDKEVNLSQGLIYQIKSLDMKGNTDVLGEVEVKSLVPNQFVLEQNYPNPFNPSTKIKFTIPTPPASSPYTKGRTEVGFVTLKVYDVLGNEVTTLVNGFMEAGEHEIEFQADNLSSGVYIYRLETKDFIETKKMVLLR